MKLFDIPIINYHKIEPQFDIGLTTRSPKQFRADLDTIEKEGFTPICFADIGSQSPLPTKPIIITFDDAYHSFYKWAFPELLKRNMRCVVYVPTAFIGKSNSWDVQTKSKKYFHMSMPELKEIANAGIEIGSHTVNHQFLNGLNAPSLKNEFETSKQQLEDITGKAILSISYPFGKANRKVLNTAQKYYNFGVKLLPLFVNGRESTLNALALNRINIYRSDSAKVFKKKMNWQYNRFVRYKNILIQQGAWATIGLQKIKNR